jgi:3-carboxy-cis,cis-muconate cycloisomerase
MVSFILEVELALAKAQEQSNLIPQSTAATLEQLFREINIDTEKLIAEIPLAGNAAAPCVKQLIAEVKKVKPEAAGYIHLGATSQDVVDTAFILKAKRYLNWLHAKLSAFTHILLQLTNQHRRTLMIGRTLMQQARAITFGLKTAGWLQGIYAARHHLRSAEKELLAIQLGGAVGSQNEYLTQPVRAAFAENLGLKNVPGWHTQRANIAAFASALGILSGTLGKIAGDIVLLSQTEVGEVFEPAAAGRGTSSTMPHKRNPILSTAILANAHRIPFLVATILAAMPQAHERSAGLWHAEWETLDDLLGLSAGAVEKSIELLEGLEVNKEQMLQNIDLTKGLVFAETVALKLAEKMGKQEAHHLVEEACQKAVGEGKHLREVLENMELNFSKSELGEFFKPENAIGQSLEIIDEILARNEDPL